MHRAGAGVDGASIAAIARACGAPNGSIYHRFPSRQHLIGALWVRIADAYRDTLIDAAATDHLRQRAIQLSRVLLNAAPD